MPRIDRPRRHRPARPAGAPAPPGQVGEATGRPPPGPSASPADRLEAAVAPQARRKLRSAIEAGLALPRSRSKQGLEPILTRHDEQRLQALFATLPAAVAHPIASLLDGLSAVGRAILLAAVSARSRVLVDEVQAPAALTVLTSFRERLASLDDRAIRVRATVLDLDGDTNSSALDPQAFWKRRGLIYLGEPDDDDPKNDGLAQRFTASCGSTALQMALAESDPILAFAIHDDGLADAKTTGPVAAFQREVLEAYGGIAIGRREAQDRARLRNALGRLGGAGDLSANEKQAVLAYVLERGPRTAAAVAGLAAMRTAFGGFPSTVELRRLRRRPLPSADEGLSTAQYLEALHAHLTPVTGVRYRSTQPAEGFARGQVYRHLDQLASTLRQGFDVPFGVSEPAHWMLATAVRGRKPHRAFLITDPDGGRTAWVTERSFKRGDFGSDVFHLESPGERPYVDCLIFPDPFSEQGA